MTIYPQYTTIVTCRYIHICQSIFEARTCKHIDGVCLVSRIGCASTYTLVLHTDVLIWSNMYICLPTLFISKTTTPSSLNTAILHELYINRTGGLQMTSDDSGAAAEPGKADKVQSHSIGHGFECHCQAGGIVVTMLQNHEKWNIWIELKWKRKMVSFEHILNRMKWIDWNDIAHDVLQCDAMDLVRERLQSTQPHDGQCWLHSCLGNPYCTSRLSEYLYNEWKVKI